MTVAVVSGGFDPLHVGHVRMIRAAREFGPVTVLLNSDEWLARKKGFSFMPWKERAEILKSIQGVARVIEADDEDGTVVHSLAGLLVMSSEPLVFCNGGDRKDENTPEVEFCAGKGIGLAFGVGGDKIQSSSALIGRARGNGHELHG